jgi:RHS repeat-associated protein
MPVDIAFGAVKLGYDDVEIPGRVPLVWQRVYSTGFNSTTALGVGWTGRYFACLIPDATGFTFVTPEGAIERLDDFDQVVAAGGVVRHLGAFLEIFRSQHRYVVQRWNVDTGEIWRYCFDAAGEGRRPLASIEDVAGNSIDVVWDDAGRLQSVRQRVERRQILCNYNSIGFIEQVELSSPDGGNYPIARYEYDGQGRLAAAYDAAGSADQFTYDRHGRIITEMLKDGGVFEYRYDDRGRCVRTSGLKRYHEKTLRYVDGARVTEVTDSYGRTSTYSYLPSGQIVAEVLPLGSRRTTDYDEYARIVSKTDANGATTRFAYDEAGNRTLAVNAVGGTTELTFNGQHQSISMRDAGGHVWRRSYDESNRLVATTDPLGNTWSFGYDAEGNIAEIGDPSGGRRFQVYLTGVLRTITDWLGHATHFKHDGFGRIVERRGPLGDVTTYRYDVMGNLLQVTWPDSVTMTGEYDVAGNPLRLVDAAGRVTTARYGSCRRLIERTNAAGETVRYRWGTEPEYLLRVTNEKGEHYDFDRDENGRVIRETAFDGAERRFRYDAEGHTTGYTNANGETVTIERDALSRITVMRLPDGRESRFVYDALGDLVSAVNDDAVVTLERDPLGRIVHETQTDHAVISRYDPRGHLTRTETNLGHSVDYHLDANGWVTRLQAGVHDVMSFEHDAYGRETLRHLGGGTHIEQRYDATGRLLRQHVWSPNSSALGADGRDSAKRELVRRDYRYTPDGALARLVDRHWGSVEYSYDAGERVTRALRDDSASEVFAYDPCGNLTVMGNGDGGPAVELAYDAGNRLARKGQTRYVYDPEGRRTQTVVEIATDRTATSTFEWDALDQLRSVILPDGARWQFRYDALGRRLFKEGPAGRTTYVWDKDVVVHEFTDEAQVDAWVYKDGRFSPTCMVTGGRLCAVVGDHLGTPHEIIDGSGQLLWSAARHVWGAKRVSSKSVVSCPFGFPGLIDDEESGLSYARFRYYDPNAGRFIAQDRIRLHGGPNFYSYTRNPVNWLDPYGLNGDVKPATYEAPTQINTGERRVEVTKISSETGQPYQHVSHYDDQGRLVGQTHYTDHGRSNVHTNPHHHRRDPETGQRLKSPPGSEKGAGTRAWPGPHPDEPPRPTPAPTPGCSGGGS